MSLDLGTARTNEPIIMHRWAYIFIGDCTGDVTIKVGDPSGSPLDPNEFDKITGIEDFKYLYVTNTTQADDKLVMYYEEIRDDVPIIDVRRE
jgi:hypothetical protein